MLKSHVDEKLKSYVSKKLRERPEENVYEVKDKLIKLVEQGKIEDVKDVIRVIKAIIKDNIPAKPKFFVLILLRDLMELQRKPFTDYFCKKIIDRLFLLAKFEFKNANDQKRGERCLKKYYKGESKENSEYSLKFFILLLECWKKWSDLFGSSHKKIRTKADKLRSLFPTSYLYYKQYQGRRPETDKSNDFNHNKIRKSLMEINKSFESQNVTLTESMFRSEVFPKGINNFYETREMLFPYIKESKEYAPDFFDFIKEIHHTMKDEIKTFNDNRERVLNSKRYSSDFKKRFESEIDTGNRILRAMGMFLQEDINFEEFRDRILGIERDIKQSSFDRFGNDKTLSNNRRNSHSLSDNSDVLVSGSKSGILNKSKNNNNWDQNRRLSINSNATRTTIQDNNKSQFDKTVWPEVDVTNEVIPEEDEGEEERDSPDVQFNNEDAFANAWDDDTFGKQDEFEDKFTFKDEPEPKQSIKISEKDYGSAYYKEETNENDFANFNPKLEDQFYNDQDGMVTIEEDSKEDYESRLSTTRLQHGSGLLNNKDAFRASHEPKDQAINIEFDDFNDADSKFNEMQAYDIKNKKIDRRKTYTQKSINKIDQKNFKAKQSADFTNFGFKEPRNNQKSLFHKSSIEKTIEEREEDSEDEQKESNKKPKKSIWEMDFNENEPVNRKGSDIFNLANLQEDQIDDEEEDEDSKPKETFKREIIDNDSDENFKSFERQEPLKQQAFIKPNDAIDSDDRRNSGTLKNAVQRNQITFGVKDFEQMEREKTESKNKLSSYVIQKEEEKINYDLNEDAVEENGFEYDFNDKDSPQFSRRFPIKETDTFNNPNFEESADEQIKTIKSQMDERMFSDHSKGIRSKLGSKDDQLVSPRNQIDIKVVEINKQTKQEPKEQTDKSKSLIHIVSVKDKSVSHKSIQDIKQAHSQSQLDNLENQKELMDLRTQKEHYRQQCDFLFKKLINLQKNNTRVSNHTDNNITANYSDDENMSRLHTKITGRKNDFLIKENKMLRKINKELVDNTNDTNNKQEMKNIILKKLVSEMELYLVDLNRNLSKLNSNRT